MLTGIESTKDLDVRHQHMLSDLKTYDKDNKAGLSLAELQSYKTDKNFSRQEVPEFAQKLVEKFEELDQNKDGQLQNTEMDALSNNRGLWQIHHIEPLPEAASVASEVAEKKDNAFTKLLKAGYEQLKDEIDVKEIVDKII